jgi:lipopolysaccharide export system protein LptA
MFGDSLYYDRKKGIGRAIKNVQIIDTTQKITIIGEYAIHYELKDLSIVTENAMLTQMYEKDTLYLHADTLKAKGNPEKNQESSSKNQDSKQLFAYHKVKFFKHDLQGKCDSLSYAITDSTMKLYGQPTLWSDQNQLTGDSMRVLTGNKSIQAIEIHGSGFIVSQEDSLHFNQIRGKNMKGFFKNNEMYRINVTGNGQTIYYAKDKEKEKEEIKAFNRADCSDLTIYLKDNKLQHITFITKPDATLYPLDKVDVKDLKLKDFTWRAESRPLTIKDIFIWE